MANTTSFVVADFPSPCELTPELLKGPFWFASDLVRRDVTEGRAGAPLRLGLRVVEASCEPLVGASVELWQADAGGHYSGYDTDPDVIPSDLSPDPKPRQNESSYLRGVQVTDADGIVEFHTIIPGWYVLRAPHLHIHIATPDGRAVATQLFLDPAFLTEVYETREPYKARPIPNVTNEHDILLATLPSESQDIVLRPKVDRDGYTATFTLAVSSS